MPMQTCFPRLPYSVTMNDLIRRPICPVLRGSRHAKRTNSLTDPGQASQVSVFDFIGTLTLVE